MKIVVNKRHGGFSISKEAAQYMASKGNENAIAELEESDDYFYGYGYAKGFDGYKRTDKDLIDVVESLGEKANGDGSELEVIEIPDDIEYTIESYDGFETIEEAHRSW